MNSFVRNNSGGISEHVDSNGKRYFIKEKTIVYTKPPPHVKIVFAYEFWEGITITIKEMFGNPEP